MDIERAKQQKYGTVDYARQQTGLCRNTLMKVAGQAGAIRKIGRAVRIDMPKLFLYIDTEYRP